MNAYCNNKKRLKTLFVSFTWHFSRFHKSTPWAEVKHSCFPSLKSILWSVVNYSLVTVHILGKGIWNCMRHKQPSLSHLASFVSPSLMKRKTERDPLDLDTGCLGVRRYKKINVFEIMINLFSTGFPSIFKSRFYRQVEILSQVRMNCWLMATSFTVPPSKVNSTVIWCYLHIFATGLWEKKSRLTIALDWMRKLKPSDTHVRVGT